MLSCFLKRVLPFVLTLAFGIALGSLFKPASAPRYMTKAVLVSSTEQDHYGWRSSCANRHRSYSRSSDAVITHKPQPLYTEAAREDGITGSVELRVELRSDGTVGQVSPVRSLPAGLTDSAIEAARSIRFIPKRVNGEAVDTTEWVEYYFDGSERGTSDF